MCLWLQVGCGSRVHIYSSFWAPVIKGCTSLLWLEWSTGNAFHMEGVWRYRDRTEPQAQRKSLYTDRKALITTFCRCLWRPLRRRSRPCTINSPSPFILIKTGAGNTPRSDSPRSPRRTACWGTGPYARSTTAGFYAMPTSGVPADRLQRRRRQANLQATLRGVGDPQKSALGRTACLILTLSTHHTTEISCSDRNTSRLVCRTLTGKKSHVSGQKAGTHIQSSCGHHTDCRGSHFI